MCVAPRDTPHPQRTSSSSPLGMEVEESWRRPEAPRSSSSPPRRGSGLGPQWCPSLQGQLQGLQPDPCPALPPPLRRHARTREDPQASDIWEGKECEHDRGNPGKISFPPNPRRSLHYAPHRQLPRLLNSLSSTTSALSDPHPRPWIAAIRPALTSSKQRPSPPPGPLRFIRWSGVVPSLTSALGCCA